MNEKTDVKDLYCAHSAEAGCARSYELGLYEKAMPENLTWTQRLTAAGKAGFDFVEISVDETDRRLARLEMSKGERLEMLKVMYECGVPIRSMCLSGHRKYSLGSSDPAAEARGMEIMEKAIELANDLGIRLIQLAGYDVYYEESSEETRERFLKNLRTSVDMAAAAGVSLGFETMENEFMNTVQKAVRYVNLINSPWLNVYPDMGNITNAALTYGTKVTEDMETGRGKLAAVHLKESLPGKFREIPFGTGHVDFELVIGKAWELGVRRYVTEFWYVGNERWTDDLQSACRIMRGYLDRFGK